MTFILRYFTMKKTFMTKIYLDFVILNLFISSGIYFLQYIGVHKEYRYGENLIKTRYKFSKHRPAQTTD